MEQPLLDVLVEAMAQRIVESVTREIRACLGKELPPPATTVTAPTEKAELVDVEQASIITSIPKRTLDNWRGRHAQRNGKGPPFVKLGQGWNALVRYRRQDLDDWARAHLVKRG
jgi:hypothetical protein